MLDITLDDIKLVALLFILTEDIYFDVSICMSQCVFGSIILIHQFKVLTMLDTFHKNNAN